MKPNYFSATSLLFLVVSLLFVLVSSCEEPVSLLSTDDPSKRARMAQVPFTLDVSNGSDITQALQTAVNVSNRQLIIPSGFYKINAPIRISVSNLTITTSGSITIESTNAVNPIIFWLGKDANDISVDVSDILIEHISLCTKVHVSNANDYYGLVYSKNTSVSNLTLNNCNFTAPHFNTNGVKLSTDDAGIISNATVQNCKFTDIGRMGIEIQSHASNSRAFQNTQCIKNTFTNLGIVDGQVTIPNYGTTPDKFGQAISLTGYGNIAKLNNNSISNPYLIGIEVTGSCLNLEVAGNKFDYLIRNRIADNNDPNTTLYIMAIDGKYGSVNLTNAHIANNCTQNNSTNTAKTAVATRMLTNSLIENNNFSLKNANYGWEIQECSNSAFVRDSVTISGQGDYGYTCQCGSSSGFYIYENSRNNYFKNIFINASASTSLAGAMYFTGGSRDNQVCGLTTILPTNSTVAFKVANDAGPNNSETCTNTNYVTGSYDPSTKKWSTSGQLIGASNYVVQIVDQDKIYRGNLLIGSTGGSMWAFTDKTPDNASSLTPGTYYLLAYSPNNGLNTYSNPIIIP